MATLTIGVLALQGSFKEHLAALQQLGHSIVPLPILYPDQLSQCDGLILPGGESTTLKHLLDASELLEPLKSAIQKGLPVWGTCAGLILLAQTIVNQTTSILGTMTITAQRNAYGTQLDSFSTIGYIPCLKEEVPLVFIRAPLITSTGPEVKILKKIDNQIVAALENNMLVTSFHPELTDSLSFHRFFVNLCSNPTPTD